MNVKKLGRFAERRTMTGFAASLLCIGSSLTAGLVSAPKLLRPGTVTIVLTQADAKIIAVGSFSEVNGAVRTNVARLNPDGSLDSTFSAAVLDPIVAVALQPDGKLLMATQAPIGDSRNTLVRLKVDGTIDSAFTAFIPGPDRVSSIGIQSDGRIILSGSFTGAVTLKRLNVNGTHDPTFHESTFGSGFFSFDSIAKIAIQSDNKVVALGGSGFGRVGRFNADGTFDQELGDVFGAGDIHADGIYDLLIQGDGKILLACRSYSYSDGSGTSYSGHGLARLNGDGTVDQEFTNRFLDGVNVLPFGYGGNLAEAPGGKLLVSGSIHIGQDALIQLNPNGSLDPSFPTLVARDIGQSFGVAQGAISVQPDGRIVVAGLFRSSGGIADLNLVQVDSAGVLDQTFRPQISRPGTVSGLIIQSPDKVVVSGDFLTLNDHVYPDIARLQSDGSIDTTFRAMTFDDSFLSLISVNLGLNNEIFINEETLNPMSGGLSGVLLRFDANGNNQTTVLQPNGYLGNPLLVQPDGRFVTAIETQQDPFSFSDTLSRFNADGSVDPSFASVNKSWIVHALVRQPDGKIVVGSSYSRPATTHFPPSTAPNVLRLNKDGSPDAAFNFSSASTDSVNALALQADGRLLIGGTIFLADSIEHVARLNSDGTLDNSFKIEHAINGSVYALALQEDGKVLLGGSFTSVGGIIVPGLARLFADGTVDSSFDAGPANGAIRAIALLPEGRLFAGGDGGLIIVSVTSPSNNEAFATGASVPFASLVVAPAIKDIKEVRFFVNDSLVDVQTVPLATNGYLGPGHPDNIGTPEFDSAVYNSDKFIPAKVGTYTLMVEVLDSAGNVVSSSTTTVMAFDPSQSPPPETFDIGGLANGSVLVANNSVAITAGPKTAGTGLTKLELLVNGSVAQQIKVGAVVEAATYSFSSVRYDAATGSYTFIFTPKAPGTFGLNIRATAGNGVTTTSSTIGVTAGPSSRLLNISTRMFVDSGDNVLIGGTIVTGAGQKKVLIRAIGPSLGAAGVAGALPDPTLELHDGNGAVIASNDDWGNSPDKQAIIDTTIPPSHPKESAILATLPSSALGINYTAIVKGADGNPGIGLVEVYDLDGNVSSSKLANIATRGKVLTGDNAMIGGFIIGGAAGAAPDKVIVRGIGPSVPLPGALADPMIEVHSAGQLLATNDNWKDATTRQEITDSGVAPINDLESALWGIINPGSYTVVVRGKDDTTGIALVEVYDLSK